MKRTFFTGLIILLPVAITLWLMIAIINILTNPFLGLVTSFFFYYGIIELPLLFSLTTKLLILIFLFATVTLIGYLASRFTFSYLFDFGGRLIHRIPIINRIYRSFRQAINAIYRTKEPTFSQVVLVPYPHNKSYAIGMITSHSKMLLENDQIHIKISVFIPSCPNPTAGLVLTFEPKKVHFLNIKVDEAIKFIISFGSIKPELSVFPHDLFFE